MDNSSEILRKIKNIRIGRLMKEQEYYRNEKLKCIERQEYEKYSKLRDKEKKIIDILEILKNDIK